MDDGSPDSCPALCEAYAQKEERVRVIHRENGGLSSARNSGIAAARGDYLAFVDADDTVAPDYLSTMFYAAQNSDADLVISGFCEMQQDSTVLPDAGRYLAEQTGTFVGRELLAHFFDPDSIYYTVAWNKLYRARIWQTLRYPEGFLHEDEAVAHRLYAACAKVTCLNEILYFYRQREGSICRSG
ncbi:glycosyltransferase, group 2 family protein, partial [gut metagenome]